MMARVSRASHGDPQRAGVSQEAAVELFGGNPTTAPHCDGHNIAWMNCCVDHSSHLLSQKKELNLLRDKDWMSSREDSSLQVLCTI